MKLVFLMTILSMSIFSASNAQEPVTLTLDKAVEVALAKNTQVIQGQYTVQGRQSSVTAAVGGLFPTLSASGSYLNRQQWTPVTSGGSQYIPGFGTIQVPGSGGHSISESYSAGLSSQLMLFDGFSNYANINSTKASENSSELSLDRTVQSTILQTHTNFLNVVRTYELMKVSEDNLKRSQRQLEQIEESNKVGSAALADVYRQRVQVGTDELGLIDAQSNYEKAKLALVAFLGVDFNNEYKFDFTGIPQDIDTTEFASVNAKYTDFNGLMSTAMEKRPDYQSSVENLNSADALVTGAKGAYYPTVSASGSYGFDNTELSNISDDKNLSISLNISLPIFSGFSLQSQVEQAEVGRNIASEQVKQAERQVRVDVRSALLDLDAAEKQVHVTQTSVTSAAMDQQIAEEKYHLGAGTLLDLLTANANYTNALSNKVNAVTGYLLAKKATEFVLGIITK